MDVGKIDPGALRLEDLYRSPADAGPAPVQMLTGKSYPYYVVSAGKFLILSLFLFGFYELYWFMTNWRRYRNVTGARVWPGARALFSIFFVHRLFALLAPPTSAVDVSGVSSGASATPSPHGALATLYVAFSVAGQLLRGVGPLLAVSLGFAHAIPWLRHAGMAITMCHIYPLFLMQATVNEAAGDPEGSRNSQLTVANCAFLLLGLVGWAGYFQFVP